MTTLALATRVSELATLLNAGRVLAVDQLQANHARRDIEHAVAGVPGELDVLETALIYEAKPRLIGRPLGESGYDLR